MSKSAKPSHEQRCDYCNIIHPASMYKNTTIVGVGRECAEKKRLLEERDQTRAINPPIEVRVHAEVEVDLVEIENRVLDRYTHDSDKS